MDFFLNSNFQPFERTSNYIYVSSVNSTKFVCSGCCQNHVSHGLVSNQYLIMFRQVVFRQSVYIPVLPARLIEMLQAPMPFLIGVPKQLLHQAVSLIALNFFHLIDIEEFW